MYEEPSRDWTGWDFRLVKAYELYEDMVANGGVPIYWDRSERVYFEVGTATSKSRAAIERREEQDQKSKTRQYGKSYYPIAKTHDGGPLPTLEEWLEEVGEQAERNKRVKRAPTPFSNEGWTPPGDTGPQN